MFPTVPRRSTVCTASTEGFLSAYAHRINKYVSLYGIGLDITSCNFPLLHTHIQKLGEILSHTAGLDAMIN